jgi:hypothetical protein
MKRKLFVLAVGTLFLGVSATFAGPLVRKDKGASNNGVADSFTACSNPTNPNNCGNFATTSTAGPSGTEITQFVTNSGDFSGPGTVILYDVFTIPGVVAPGSVLTLNLSPSDIDFGIFACGNGDGGAVSGDSKALTGPCTVGDLGFSSIGNTPLDQMITDTISGNTVTIDFKNDPSIVGFPSSWAFFTDPKGLVSLSLSNGTTPTPEPGSGSLLFVGALAAGLLALKSRR